MTFRCEGPSCPGETIPGVRLGAINAEGKTIRGTVAPARISHGFIVGDRRLCGKCSRPARSKKAR